jgi:hypothetical protein
MPRQQLFVMTWALLFAVAITNARMPYGIEARLAVNIAIGCCGGWLVSWFRKRRL